jgi:hypothetical protein
MEFAMNCSIRLVAVRRLDNRFEGLSDDSPRALELHNRRKNALHAVFDSDPVIKVTDWGKTDDSRSHESVEVLLGAAATAVFRYAIVPGVKWLGLKLAEKAVDTTLSEFAKAVVAKLRPKQEAKQLLDFFLKLPDGTQIAVDPPEGSATIRINFADGAVQSLEYLKAVDEGAG